MQDNTHKNDKTNTAEQEEKKDQPISKPDPETLHTTDPQENMKGPVSSFMQGLKKEAEKPGDEDAEKVRQADENKK